MKLLSNNLQFFKKSLFAFVTAFFCISVFSQPAQRELVLAEENDTFVQSDPRLKFATSTEGKFYCLDVSPDGKYLASGFDLGVNTIEIWDFESGKKLKSINFSNWAYECCYAVKWSPDSKLISAFIEGEKFFSIKVINIQTGAEVFAEDYIDDHLTSFVRNLYWSSNGKYLFAFLADGGCICFDIKAGMQTTIPEDISNEEKIIVETIKNYDWGFEIWDYSVNEHLIAVIGEDDKICILNTKTNELKSILPIEDRYSFGSAHPCVHLTSNGLLLCCYSEGGDKYGICMYDTETLIKETDIESSSGSFVLSISSIGNLILAGTYNGNITCYDAKSKKIVKEFGGYSNPVSSIEISLDGKFFRNSNHYSDIGCIGDDNIEYWDLKTGKKLLTAYITFTDGENYFYKGAEAFENVVWGELSKDSANGYQTEISNDSVRIVGNRDGTIEVYDKKTNSLKYTCINGKDGEYLTYTPEGFFTGTEWACKNLVYIVDGLEVTELTQLYDKLYRPDLIAAKARGEDISAEGNFISFMRTGKPPVVSVSDSYTVSDGGDCTFSFSVKDCGGGIGDVRFFLNGNPKIPGAYGAKVQGNGIVYTQTVPLVNGKNTIEILAYNKAGSVESLHKTISVEWNGKISKPNLFVLVLGINQYKVRKNRLQYAVPDAQAIAQEFKSQNSRLYQNISVHSLIDSEVTKDGISKKFSELSPKIKKDDVFIFYLAGHGITYRGDYYYIPVDYNASEESQIPEMGISKHDFVEYLSQIDAGKTLILLDTCDSGSFMANAKTRGGVTEELDVINRLKKTVGSAIISASRDDQSALEGYEGHGAFTYVLLEALKGKGDVDGDGYVSVAELSLYLGREVPKLTDRIWGYYQTPQVRIEKQDFPISQKR